MEKRFTTLPPTEVDQIMLAHATWAGFRDAHPGAVNTTIGVLIDPETGRPWRPKVLLRSWEETLKEITNTGEYGYQGQAGNQAFLEVLTRSILVEDLPEVLRYQTLGGTGALSLVSQTLLELVKKPQTGQISLVLDPGWPNHPAIFSGPFRIIAYPHLNKTGTYNHQGALQAITSAPEGSVMLFQTGGYNDDGADRTPQQWDEIIDAAQAKKAVVILDAAYLGLADDFEADRYPIVQCLQKGLLTFVCVSCSKNMGLYNERVGALLVLNAPGNLGDEQAQNLHQLICRTVRRTISSAPLLAAKAAAKALAQPEYFEELEQARQRLVVNRRAFATYLGKDLPNVASGKGLFTKLFPNGFTARQQTFLNDKGILVLANSRINLGGMSLDEIEKVGKFLQILISTVKK